MAIRGIDSITSNIRDALAITEPDLDTTIGSPVRKLIDAFAESLAEMEVDQYLLNYVYDIDSKTGADLDSFVAVFGFSRYEAKRSTGTITFERPLSNALGVLLIPQGTQVGTLDSPPIIFSVTTAGLLSPGVTSIEIPARAVLGGTSGNVPTFAIRQWITPIAGISSMGNTVPFQGGTSAETDEQLRSRFKRTVFRSLAGTEDMYLGVALQDDDVTLANVIGAAKRRNEQIYLDPATGPATSTVRDAKHVYPNSEIVGRDLMAGDVFGSGIQYSFDPVVPPSITSLNAAVMSAGVYELEYDYVPNASRNDPSAGITNRVDVYVNGVRSVTASETLLWTDQSVFSDVPYDPLFVGSFKRPDGGPPVAGNYFLKYSFTPVLQPATDPTLPHVINVNGTEYVEGQDFFLVNDYSPNGMCPRSNSGIEWVSAANGAISPIPEIGSTIFATYAYNEVPTSVQATLDNEWRLVTSDVRVHQATFIRLSMYLAVIYSRGISIDATNVALRQALSDTLNAIDFDGAVQISDLLAAAHGVNGIDAVRFLNSYDDPINYGIYQIADDGITKLNVFDDGGTPARARDIIMSDNEVPILNDLVVVARAMNSFGAF